MRRGRKSVKLAAAVFVTATLVLQAAQAAERRVAAPEWPIFRTHGISVRYPLGWHATARRLTGVISPPLRFAIASYPLRQKRPGSTCTPSRALAEMPPSGAFIYAMEYTGTSAQTPDFRPRPKRFRLTRFASYECMGPSYAILFRDAGRSFQIHVYIGKKAGPTVRATVLRILNSFRAKRI
jgi:hypothetical protein